MPGTGCTLSLLISARAPRDRLSLSHSPGLSAEALRGQETNKITKQESSRAGFEGTSVPLCGLTSFFALLPVCKTSWMVAEMEAQRH